MWGTLKKAAEGDVLISYTLVRAKSPFEASQVLNSTVKDQDTDLAKDNDKKISGHWP